MTIQCVNDNITLLCRMKRGNKERRERRKRKDEDINIKIRKNNLNDFVLCSVVIWSAVHVRMINFIGDCFCNHRCRYL